MEKTVEPAITLLGKEEDENESFKRMFLDAIDETLKHFFNDVAVGAIYFYMEKTCCLRKEEIAGKPEAFSACLHRLMGAGALVIEDRILKTLCSKLGLQSAQESTGTFSERIVELRRSRVP